jgi:hypothetical protein
MKLENIQYNTTLPKGNITEVTFHFAMVGEEEHYYIKKNISGIIDAFCPKGFRNSFWNYTTHSHVVDVGSANYYPLQTDGCSHFIVYEPIKDSITVLDAPVMIFGQDINLEELLARSSVPQEQKEDV